MVLAIINLFATYLLVALVFRVILQVIPQSIRSGFEVLADIRVGISTYVQSLYSSKTNAEVNLLAIFVIPFVILLFAYSFLSVLVFGNTDYPVINIWLILVLLFVLSFMAPTPEELHDFRSITPLSVFFLVFKVFLVFQLAFDQLADYYTLTILIFPISPLLEMINSR